jgi:hypothetical protein
LLTKPRLIGAAGLRWPVEEDFTFSDICMTASKKHQSEQTPYEPRAAMLILRIAGCRQELLRPGSVPGPAYTAILRHVVPVMAALAICAATAALPKMAPIPRPRRLSGPPGQAARWLNWRRGHQARFRWFHQCTRLNRDNALVS